MGIDLHLEKDGKPLVSLGRAYNYESEYTQDEITKEILKSIMICVVIIGNNGEEAIKDILDTIENDLEELVKIGRASVIEELKEEGIEVIKE